MATPTADAKSTPKAYSKRKVLSADYIPEVSDIEEMDLLQLEVEIERLKIILAQMLRHAANTDSASGLPNRQRFMELASAEFNRARRYHSEFSLIVATISGYGELLETKGEEAANNVLLRLAEVCTGSTRIGIDIVGRLGPDKLAIVLPETGTKDSTACLERMHSVLDAVPMKIDGQPVKTKMNFSVRTLKKSHNSFLELLVST